MSASCDVLIVNWNSGQQLRSCLSSIAESKDRQKLSSVVVVDNGSTDGSADCLCCFQVPLRLIRNASNCGFAAAVNQAEKTCSGDFLLLLNPDTLLEPDSLQHSLVFFELHPEAGVVGVQLIADGGIVQRTCARIPTAIQMVARSFGLHRRGEWRDYVMTEWDHCSTRQVDHVIGAFYMIRRSVFEQLGGMDERFFLYLEDLDLSLRVRRAGWRVFFLAETRAYHKGGGSSEKVKAQRVAYSLESRILFCYKHHNWAAATAVLCSSLLIEPFVRVSKAALKLDSAELSQVTRGYLILWRRLVGRLLLPSRANSRVGRAAAS